MSLTLSLIPWIQPDQAHVHVRANLQLADGELCTSADHTYISYTVVIDAVFASCGDGSSNARLYASAGQAEKPYPNRTCVEAEGYVVFWRGERDVSLHVVHRDLRLWRVRTEDVPRLGVLNCSIMGLAMNCWIRTAAGVGGTGAGRVDVQLEAGDNAKTRVAVLVRTASLTDLKASLGCLIAAIEMGGAITLATATFTAMGFDGRPAVPVFNFETIYAFALPSNPGKVLSAVNSLESQNPATPVANPSGLPPILRHGNSKGKEKETPRLKRPVASSDSDGGAGSLTPVAKRHRPDPTLNSVAGPSRQETPMPVAKRHHQDPTPMPGAGRSHQGTSNSNASATTPRNSNGTVHIDHAFRTNDVVPHDQD
ncbi:hypothetical protein FRC04_005824 [Tulasnella sp. 424]|nr:hypothetical protein FRC04_005824 [Tulasnella sp. 424]KAG8962737.1 hypothetical protein FRC05_005139 [Tulasnella sp. 425]